MPTRSFIDVSVVTHDSERWLEPLLASLLAQTTATTRISLLIRDNASRDETLARLDELRARHAGRFARFDVEADGRNLGFGAGHNRNLARGRADLFLVLNPDLELEPDALVRLEAEATGAPEDVVAWELRQAPYEHPKHYDPVTGETAWCSGAALLLRRRALEAVGGFDERIFLYGEDVDLSLRLREAGFRLLYAPKAVATHHTYTEPYEVKPRQFLGSTLANLYLRTRFGSTRQILAGLARYVLLLAAGPRYFPGQRRGLLRNLGRYLRNAPHFLRNRARRRFAPPFDGWDYGFMRAGAFHPLPAPSARVCTPLVSVLVRTAGRPAALREALASVARQTHPNLEVVVVEDGPPDAEPLIAREFAPLRVVYRATGARQGRCAAGNLAMSLASGEYLVFLDDDDLLYADHVEVLVNAVQAHGTLAAYSLALEVPTLVHGWDPYRYTEIERHAHIVHAQPFSRALLWHHNYMPIQSVLFHRSLYEELGGFDLELENLEDWNLWVRYSLRHDFAFVPKLTSRYRVPGDPEEQASRQRTMDGYLEHARRKLETMHVTLSLAEVLRCHEELSRALDVVRISMADVRRVLARSALGPWGYALARDAYRTARSLAGRRRLGSGAALGREHVRSTPTSPGAAPARDDPDTRTSEAGLP